MQSNLRIGDDDSNLEIPVVEPIAVPPGLPPFFSEYYRAVADLDAARRRLDAVVNSRPVLDADRREAEVRFERAASRLEESKHDIATLWLAGLRIAIQLFPGQVDSLLRQAPAFAAVLDAIALLKRVMYRLTRKRGAAV